MDEKVQDKVQDKEEEETGEKEKEQEDEKEEERDEEETEEKEKEEGTSTEDERVRRSNEHSLQNLEMEREDNGYTFYGMVNTHLVKGPFAQHKAGCHHGPVVVQPDALTAAGRNQQCHESCGNPLFHSRIRSFSSHVVPLQVKQEATTANSVQNLLIEVPARQRSRVLENIVTYYSKGSHAVVITGSKAECDELADGRTFNTLTSQVQYTGWTVCFLPISSQTHLQLLTRWGRKSSRRVWVQGILFCDLVWFPDSDEHTTLSSVVTHRRGVHTCRAMHRKDCFTDDRLCLLSWEHGKVSLCCRHVPQTISPGPTDCPWFIYPVYFGHLIVR